MWLCHTGFSEMTLVLSWLYRINSEIPKFEHGDLRFLSNLEIPWFVEIVHWYFYFLSPPQLLLVWRLEVCYTCVHVLSCQKNQILKENKAKKPQNKNLISFYLQSEWKLLMGVADSDESKISGDFCCWEVGLNHPGLKGI